MTDAPRAIDPAFFDENVPASEDFFRYANGGWLDANPVPPEYGSWGAFHEVNERNQKLLHHLLLDAAKSAQVEGTPSRMVGDYFAAAMDVDAIALAGAAPLAPYLERVAAVASIADVRALAGDLQPLAISVLVDVGIAPDFEDANAYLVYVGQGGLGLPERDYYTRDDERSIELREAYVGHIAKQLVNLGDDAGAARAAAERILAFETRLAEACYTNEQLRDVNLTMNRHSVDSLDELMPAFGLTGFVRELGVTSASVNIDNAGFFTALEATLAEAPIETLRDYLRWNLVRAYASSLSPAFEDEAFDFFGRTLGGQQHQRPRWKRVLVAASADIGEQVARLYVAAAFPEQAKHRCEKMVDQLLVAMGDAIRDAEWMTDATKPQALEKLAGFTYKIGYPDEWRDYSALSIGRTSHAENRMACAAFEHDRELRRLGEPVDTREWAMPAHSVNAYYHPLLNEVVFPAGILQPPFFYAEADDAVNYGAIGAVIGHEITHGFDDRGSHFDAKGSLREWWTEADRAEFDRRAQVLVEQFDAYVAVDDLHVNGRLTLGENIADLGGLTIALAALRKVLPTDAPLIDGLTSEQRFFLSWATVWHTNFTDEYARLLVNVDPHSPARVRVNGPLANLPAFAAAFQIPDGTPMVRAAELRAHIW
ncbi:MAG: M13 family metallopeptidase [Coriobacteriia bacterium]|nr:M13 family metallopeptidase [Coriobacteriia bacterium]